jgi:radical SAM superfamily enzyme YgiQ (UPF0313 family)
VSSTTSCTMLLLHPPGACSAFTRSGSQYPPLGLLQLKALIADPCRVNVIEADGYGMTVQETAQQIANDAPQALGMTVICGTKALTHAWSTIAKNLAAGYDPIVIAGGPAAAFETDLIMRDCPNVDVVAKGEGEVVFPHMVSILESHAKASRHNAFVELSKLPGVCVRNMPQANDKTIPKLPRRLSMNCRSLTSAHPRLQGVKSDKAHSLAGTAACLGRSATGTRMALALEWHGAR